VSGGGALLGLHLVTQDVGKALLWDVESLETPVPSAEKETREGCTEVDQVVGRFTPRTLGFGLSNGHEFARVTPAPHLPRPPKSRVLDRVPRSTAFNIE